MSLECKFEKINLILVKEEIDLTRRSLMLYKNDLMTQIISNAFIQRQRDFWQLVDLVGNKTWWRDCRVIENKQPKEYWRNQFKLHTKRRK